MGAYLAIIRGVITLANAIARGLQQHHDEINGENKIIAVENAQTAKAEVAASQELVDTDRARAINQLRDGSA